MTVMGQMQMNAADDAKLEAYAAAALQGLIAAKHPEIFLGNGYKPERAAAIAFDFANAMVVERQKHIRGNKLRTASTLPMVAGK